MTIKMTLSAFLTVLLLSTPASAMWGIWDPQAMEYDLVVEGTLGDIDSKLIQHRGQLFSEETGSIKVHRVLYKQSRGEVPKEVTLYSCQSTELHCPRVFHRGLQGRTGVWLLRRTKVKNVYTAYVSKPVIEEKELKFDAPQTQPQPEEDESENKAPSDLDEIPWILGPDIQSKTTLISWPDRSTLYLWILLGFAPIYIRGRTWQFTKLSKSLGYTAIAVSSSLLMWTYVLTQLIHSH
ncbi:MAG: hypothetical protein P1V97_33920 [Planctomycetota bacterium]|nr:hypothetical protein [Planctomycetota bacterium]